MSALEATDLFLSLTPERVLAAVETGGLSCNNLCYPLNSFENRVYEVELVDRSRIVAKFYRPGRWNQAQILEEHQFLAELAAAELPVCTVRPFPDGSTLKRVDRIHYSLADRRGGRAPDELNPGLARRLGMLVGRMHGVAATETTSTRRPLNAEHFIRRPLNWLEEHGNLPQAQLDRYLKAAETLADLTEPLEAAFDVHRLHADLHLGNVLLRDDQFHLLDFDDSCVGPPVQDLWLALPGRDDATLALRQSFLEGYEQFRLFDRASLVLIEPLRGLRMVRYAVWLARRWHDPAFRAAWPHFGTSEYWEGEIADLEEQIAVVRSDLRRSTAAVAETLDFASDESPPELSNKDYFWDWEEEE